MRTFVKTTLILLCIGGCSLLATLLSWVGAKEAKWRVIQGCYRGLLRIIGIQVTISGELVADRPLLLITNHTTYLDIIVLGAHLPVRFCPKAEIGGWPLIGQICRLTGCVFIDRRPQKTASNRKALHDALAEGSVVCLFPEGTTGDGTRLLQFHSSYFSLGEERFNGIPLVVQSAGIVYTHVCNMPLDSMQRHKISWYGDMALVPHAAEMLRLGPIRATLTFCEPVDMSRFKNRKEMAVHCQQEVDTAIRKAVSA